MIQQLVAMWNEKKGVLESWLQEKHPESYEDLFTKLIALVLNETVEGRYTHAVIDPTSITVLNHGSYQGTQIFLMALTTYQPDADDYLWMDNYYGSCSGCDALQSIQAFKWTEKPDEEQVEAYMLLALQMVQRIRWLVAKPEHPRTEQWAVNKDGRLGRVERKKQYTDPGSGWDYVICYGTGMDGEAWKSRHDEATYLSNEESERLNKTLALRGG